MAAAVLVHKETEKREKKTPKTLWESFSQSIRAETNFTEKSKNFGGLDFVSLIESFLIGLSHC